MSESRPDKTCLSFWFPRIEAAGLPVPKTRIVRAGVDLTAMVDGDALAAGGYRRGFNDFLGKLAVAADAMGYPAFLRTGHTSGKHDWLETCCVADRKDLGQYVYNLVKFSCMAGIMGLPTNVWAIREMLPTTPFFTAFNGMPICREFRRFVDGPEVVCWHPYWPRKALVEGFPLLDGHWPRENCRQLPENFDKLYESLCKFSEDDHFKLFQFASLAGKTLGDAWSVDLIETANGWFLTDMAEADKSFHWEGCEHARRFAQLEQE